MKKSHFYDFMAFFVEKKHSQISEYLKQNAQHSIHVRKCTAQIKPKEISNDTHVHINLIKIRVLTYK